MYYENHPIYALIKRVVKIDDEIIDEGYFLHDMRDGYFYPDYWDDLGYYFDMEDIKIDTDFRTGEYCGCGNLWGWGASAVTKHGVAKGSVDGCCNSSSIYLEDKKHSYSVSYEDVSCDRNEIEKALEGDYIDEDDLDYIEC